MKYRVDPDLLNTLLPALVAENRFYHVTEPYGCGAFDGGCLGLALALKRLIGGELYALFDTRDRPQHAVVYIGDGLYVDGSGVKTYNELVDYWLDYEQLRVDYIGPANTRMLHRCGFWYCQALTKRMVRYIEPYIRKEAA